MTVTITWGDPVQIQAIAEAVGAAVEDGGAEYFPQLSGVQAQAARNQTPAQSVPIRRPTMANQPGARAKSAPSSGPAGSRVRKASAARAPRRP